MLVKLFRGLIKAFLAIAVVFVIAIIVYVLLLFATEPVDTHAQEPVKIDCVEGTVIQPDGSCMEQER